MSWYNIFHCLITKWPCKFIIFLVRSLKAPYFKVNVHSPMPIVKTVRVRMTRHLIWKEIIPENIFCLKTGQQSIDLKYLRWTMQNLAGLEYQVCTTNLETSSGYNHECTQFACACALSLSVQLSIVMAYMKLNLPLGNW